ncbi:transmembrane protein, putative [Medicago truncatula]|uniref:Transmembrane protein, putative n=1 Tax=Medicago truncatula TaxID=3880 RepID=A0A072UIJ0_MEDTR|nr:transmembrane protein, putative [Medicago truncatula]
MEVQGDKTTLGLGHSYRMMVVVTNENGPYDKHMLLRVLRILRLLIVIVFLSGIIVLLLSEKVLVMRRIHNWVTH